MGERRQVSAITGQLFAFSSCGVEETLNAERPSAHPCFPVRDLHGESLPSGQRLRSLSLACSAATDSST